MAKMSVYEYRKNHPKCGYCKHSDVLPFTCWYACEAKGTLFAFGAKKCPLYNPLQEWED